MTVPSGILMEAGLPAPPNLIKGVPGDMLLGGVLNILNKQIRAPLEEEQYEKVAWLYDRIAGRLGRPLANSYGRVRPEDVVE
jgi:hypothetical protein